MRRLGQVFGLFEHSSSCFFGSRPIPCLSSSLVVQSSTQSFPLHHPSLASLDPSQVCFVPVYSFIASFWGTRIFLRRARLQPSRRISSPFTSCTLPHDSHYILTQFLNTYQLPCTNKKLKVNWPAHHLASLHNNRHNTAFQFHSCRVDNMDPDDSVSWWWIL